MYPCVMDTSCASRKSEKALVDPEREYAYIFQELLVVNWAQLAVAGRGLLSHTHCFREKHRLSRQRPALDFSICAHPYEEAPEIIFQPVQLRPALSNWTCRTTSSFASLLANQSGSIMTIRMHDCDQSGKGYWINQTVQIWIPHLHKNGPARD